MKLPMIRPLICAAVASAALLAWPTESSAGESYDNCSGFIDSLPAVITTQGTWCLRSDLSTAIAGGDAIEIATNNVTLDCNDFKIGGLAAGLDTLANGVRARDRFNTTVRNCRIRGFRIGISLSGAGGGHKVENNHLEGSTSTGINVRGAGSVVRGNRVIDSGGSTISAVAVEAGISVGGGGVDVVDNLVSGVHVFPIQVGGIVISRGAAGINAVNNDGGSIIGNRISGLVPVGTETAFGIRILGTFGTTRNIVSGNILRGSGSAAITGLAIACVDFGEGVDAISVDNVLIGFDAAYQDCTPGNDSINTN